MCTCATLLRRMPPKRRRLGLTNYRKRLKLVKSGLPRLVVRRSNRYILVQVIESVAGGDRTLVSAHSKELRNYGWRCGLKNTPAAYLTGLLAGLRAKAIGKDKLIADLGLFHKASRLYAAIKGALDAGVEIPVSEEVIPSEDRIKGKHIENYLKELLKMPPRNMFTKVDHEACLNISKHFEEVKQRIVSEVLKDE